MYANISYIHKPWDIQYVFITIIAKEEMGESALRLVEKEPSGRWSTMKSYIDDHHEFDNVPS